MFKIKNIFKRKSPAPPAAATDSPSGVSTSASTEATATSSNSSGDSTTLEISFQQQLNVNGTGKEVVEGDVRVMSSEALSTGESSEVYANGDEAESSDTSEEPEDVFAEQVELKDYMLIQKIGEGAFSKVYRGVPSKYNNMDSGHGAVSSQNRQVAIKVIIKQQLPDSEKNGERQVKASTTEQVLKEIAIHKMVSSGENIVTFIEFQESERYYYIIQELLTGGEIFGEIVKYTYFSEDLSRHVIKQLANAVKHMHTLGVVHRDIKPENLLFEPIDFIPRAKPKFRKSDDPSTKLDEGEFRPGIGGGGVGVVKLADFGLSKQIYQTNTKTPCGTVGYTAPEVVKDERYSMQVDMWGVGCVLYTVLCGFPPFFDEKIDVLTEKISRGEYTFLRPWWDEISDGAKNCVRKLLEVDPAKRYTADQLLQDRWLNAYDCEADSRPLSDLVNSKRRHSHKHNRKIVKQDTALLYSPAAVAMRDAFDVSNAVQRIEYDKRMTPGPNNHLGILPEDAEAELQHHEPFNLKLDSSSIIKRRRNNV